LNVCSCSRWLSPYHFWLVILMLLGRWCNSCLVVMMVRARYCHLISHLFLSILLDDPLSMMSGMHARYCSDESVIVCLMCSRRC